MTQPYGQEPAGGQPEYGQPAQPYAGQGGYAQQPYQQPPAQYGQPYQQQPYQQQPYQQGPYPGQPGERPSAVANAYGAPIGSGAKFGVVGATFAGVGLVLLIISFTALAWFGSDTLHNSHFSDIHDRCSRTNPTAPPASRAPTSRGWAG